MTRAFIIDTDTASDDAVALIMALRARALGFDVEVKAITVVCGNMPVDQGVQNALYSAELCGSDVPVYRGADRPLTREPFYAFWFHGNDGLSDRGFAPTRRTTPTPGHGVEALIETVKANPGVTLVTLGPLTNVALAVRRAPEIAGLIERCVVMGGAAVTSGNVTPAAEYNIWVDPEAAQIAFTSGIPIEMAGWELCRGEAALLPAEMDAVRSLDTDLARFAMDSNIRAQQAAFEQSGEPGLTLPDPVAMAIALDPDAATARSRHYVQVETLSELTRGMTVVDKHGVTREGYNQAVWGRLREREPNVSVCWSLDVPKWKTMLRAAVR
ncbi:MAG: nucleoside hydrolase [bacterium]|nr:nucleoside hydrolase [bacterium]